MGLQSRNSPRWAIMSAQLRVDIMKNQVEHFTSLADGILRG